MLDHELSEVVSQLLKYQQQAVYSNPENIAIDAAHGVAFHRGLGAPITPSQTTPYEKYLSGDALAQFAQDAYAKSNVALVATGPNSAEISKWVGQFFKDLPTGSSSSQYKVQPTVATKYFGGEQRIPSKTGNAVVIAFPGSSAFGTSGYKAEASVLAALLGGESSIKWTPGFSLLSQATQGFSQLNVSTKNHTYSDAGLFTVTLTGAADQVGAASKNVVDALKKAAAGEVASEDIKKAIALAKFRALESVQTLETGLEATGSGLVHGSKAYQIGEIAKALEGVSEQQVKEVCVILFVFVLHLPYTDLYPFRPPSPSSLARLPSSVSATSTSSRTLRTLACQLKLSRVYHPTPYREESVFSRLDLT